MILKSAVIVNDDVGSERMGPVRRIHDDMAKVECSNAQLTVNLTSKFERNLQLVLQIFVMKIKNFIAITQFLY